jgi:hypothetical protein
MGQCITATFDCFWDSLPQLRLMVSGAVSQLPLLYLRPSITATFDGSWDSLTQLRFIVCRTVYHSYVCCYLGQSITANFDGI